MNSSHGVSGAFSKPESLNAPPTIPQHTDNFHPLREDQEISIPTMLPTLGAQRPMSPVSRPPTPFTFFTSNSSTKTLEIESASNQRTGSKGSVDMDVDYGTFRAHLITSPISPPSTTKFPLLPKKPTFTSKQCTQPLCRSTSHRHTRDSGVQTQQPHSPSSTLRVINDPNHQISDTDEEAIFSDDDSICSEGYEKPSPLTSDEEEMFRVGGTPVLIKQLFHRGHEFCGRRREGLAVLQPQTEGWTFVDADVRDGKDSARSCGRW